MPKITITLSNNLGGEPRELELEAKWAVCPDCKGEGRHLRHAMRGYAYSREEWEEIAEDVARGVYNVECETCGGKRVVPELDESRLQGRQAKRSLLKRIRRQQRELEADRRAWQREIEREHLMLHGSLDA